ncbi:hypothetical protein L208DRAFT_1383260 [Tricholoma matsutake]|nr:hypothetical protein L208DRAFT_1383260 [Tricholoma matsutake 945]
MPVTTPAFSTPSAPVTGPGGACSSVRLTLAEAMNRALGYNEGLNRQAGGKKHAMEIPRHRISDNNQGKGKGKAPNRQERKAAAKTAGAPAIGSVLPFLATVTKEAAQNRENKWIRRVKHIKALGLDLKVPKNSIARQMRAMVWYEGFADSFKSTLNLLTCCQNCGKKLSDYNMLLHLDKTGLKYSIHIRHLRCLSHKGWLGLLTDEMGDNGVVTTCFCEGLHSHPNICNDGWVWVREQYERYCSAGDTRPFPSQPHFWNILAVGSIICAWPPEVFYPWVEMVKNGEELTLQSHLDITPNASPTAGPSAPTAHSPIASPAPSPLSSLSPSPSPSPFPLPLPPPYSLLQFPPSLPASPTHSGILDWHMKSSAPSFGQGPDLGNVDASESLQIKKEMMEDNASLTLAASAIAESGMLDIDSFQLVIPGPNSRLSTPAPITQLLTSAPATPASASQTHNSAGHEEDASLWDTVDRIEDDVFMEVEY